MSVIVTSDVAGHSLTLDVNGAKIVMDLTTAYKVTYYIGHTLDQLSADHINKRQQERINGEYFSHEQL
jgi:hypothetical protein